MFPATTRDRSMTRKPWSIPWKSGLKDFCCIGTSSTSLCPTQWGHVSITALLGSALHYHGWTIGATGAGAHDELARMYCCSWQYDLLQPLTCPYSTNILEESAVRCSTATCQQSRHGQVCLPQGDAAGRKRRLKTRS